MRWKRVKLLQVEDWFSNNRVGSERFMDADALAHMKKKQKARISCVIPTFNEEDNIGRVIDEIVAGPVRKKIVDEIVVMDSGSTDGTKEAAEAAGAEFHYAKDILERVGSETGKGENLWKGLFVTSGNIIACLDADIRNINERFVYGLVGPLLQDSKVGFTKAYYRRAFRAGGLTLEGGRVTELLIRPLFNLYFPRLSAFIQPLSGEYAGRRHVLERVPFFAGYGVEMGLLIDIERKFGLDSMVQVDLDERIHRNRPLSELGKMSFDILQSFSEKANRLGVFVNMDKINSVYTMIEPKRAERDYSLSRDSIVALQRPPMITLPEYRSKFGLGHYQAAVH